MTKVTIWQGNSILCRGLFEHAKRITTQYACSTEETILYNDYRLEQTKLLLITYKKF